ncbi:hypothetical protein RJV04_005111 [Salmonella enterica]|nr:hypothetical protein [Salmonella enterica]
MPSPTNTQTENQNAVVFSSGKRKHLSHDKKQETGLFSYFAKKIPKRNKLGNRIKKTFPYLKEWNSGTF